MLQPIDHPLGYFAMVIAHVDQNRATVTTDEDVTGIRRFGIFLGRVETSATYESDHIDGAADGGETVIRSDEDAGAIAGVFFFQRNEKGREIIVNRFRS